MVSTNINNFTPKAGDVAVFPKTGNRKWGHISMYNGNQWVSDFKQNSFFVHTDYVKANKYAIYRYNGK